MAEEMLPVVPRLERRGSATRKRKLWSKLATEESATVAEDYRVAAGLTLGQAAKKERVGPLISGRLSCMAARMCWLNAWLISISVR
jgi:hypothetical protein